MKLIRTLSILTVLFATATTGQVYHDPAGILKILGDSRVSYEIGTLETPDVEIIKYPPQIDHGLFLKKCGNGTRSVRSYADEYGGSKEYSDNLRAAEKAFEENHLTQARDLYLKALSAAPASSQLMTFIGQTYGLEGNDSLAESWYRKAIEANYFDYAAHWFLADLCENAGRKDEAVTEILVSAILNRNNRKILETLETIFKNSGMSYSEWEFKPLYEVKDLGNNKASIKYVSNHPEWLPYAQCKALWHIEPGYRDSMLNGTNEHPLVVEEKECVVNVLIGLYKSKQVTKDRALQVAEKALEKKMFSEYLVYDVILPGNPRFAFVLPREFFVAVSRYIVSLRSGTEPQADASHLFH